jgi:hypothetical protein
VRSTRKQDATQKHHYVIDAEKNMRRKSAATYIWTRNAKTAEERIGVAANTAQKLRGAMQERTPPKEDNKHFLTQKNANAKIEEREEHQHRRRLLTTKAARQRVLMTRVLKYLSLLLLVVVEETINQLALQQCQSYTPCCLQKALLFFVSTVRTDLSFSLFSTFSTVFYDFR